MNITEKFKNAIIFVIHEHRAALFSHGMLSCEGLETIIRNLTIEHEGKKYALKIVELDAELPHNPYPRQKYGKAQKDMRSEGWVKGVNDEKG